MVGKACTANLDCTTALCKAKVCTLLNGCDSVTAIDLTTNPTPTVQFGGSAGTYTPACLKIVAGGNVTFQGNFSPHPHTGGIVDGTTAAEDPASPFYPAQTSGNSKTYNLPTFGAYPYYCKLHYKLPGYKGVVYVVGAGGGATATSAKTPSSVGWVPVPILVNP